MRSNEFNGLLHVPHERACVKLICLPFFFGGRLKDWMFEFAIEVLFAAVRRQVLQERSAGALLVSVVAGGVPRRLRLLASPADQLVDVRAHLSDQRQKAHDLARDVVHL